MEKLVFLFRVYKGFIFDFSRVRQLSILNLSIFTRHKQ